MKHNRMPKKFEIFAIVFRQITAFNLPILFHCGAGALSLQETQAAYSCGAYKSLLK